MERQYKLEMKARVAKRALGTLKEIMDEPYSVIIRDAAIQRFEYTFEAIWKLIKEYLIEREGIVCNSPKSCFREAFRIHLLNESESMQALYMTDDRNMTTHTYHEDVAEEIYRELSGYYVLMDKVYWNIVRDLERNDL
ncbi:MAG: HI0074 family nucleotidyltransferase substrate-binding subunit [Methanolobus sp.]|nr:HI0074 family nucleotidyltransferase substrate-binding subunit [Methanolobus sp.]